MLFLLSEFSHMGWISQIRGQKGGQKVQKSETANKQFCRIMCGNSTSNEIQERAWKKKKKKKGKNTKYKEKWARDQQLTVKKTKHTDAPMWSGGEDTADNQYESNDAFTELLQRDVQHAGIVGALYKRWVPPPQSLPYNKNDQH